MNPLFENRLRGKKLDSPALKIERVKNHVVTLKSFELRELICVSIGIHLRLDNPSLSASFEDCRCDPELLLLSRE